MIKFFRKIRQQLLTENKFSKYLLYAIGEIVLVVIGILIALSINNWNNNLQADLTGIKEIKIFRDSSRAYSVKYLKIAKNDKITIEDFAEIEYSNYNVFWDLYFKSHQSGFEALKNSGFIGKLNGTKLEENLNEYYYVLDKMQIENKEAFFSSQQKDIKKLINHPSMIAANIILSEIDNSLIIKR
jgi:hypothetical protein